MINSIPLEALGAEAVRMIDWRMRNPHEPPRRVVLPAPLVEGETVGEVGGKPAARAIGTMQGRQQGERGAT